ALLLPSARLEPCSPTTARGEVKVHHAPPVRGKRPAAGASASVKAREHEDRDLPAGLVLILDKNGHLGGLVVEQALALLPRGHGGLDPKALVCRFDRRPRGR